MASISDDDGFVWSIKKPRSLLRDNEPHLKNQSRYQIMHKQQFSFKT
jgi:hypothetical protein